MFDDVTFKNATLYVPEGEVKSYQAATGWKNFVNIVEGIPTGVKSVCVDEPESIETVRYNVNGGQIVRPTKGLNIIKSSDGTVKKTLVK